MATNSLAVMPSTGIATPYAWEVRESLHGTNLERHPNFIEGPSNEISLEDLTYKSIIPTFSDNSLTISHQKIRGNCQKGC